MPANTSKSRTSRKNVGVSALNAHLGYWRRFVSNHVSQAFKVKVERHGVTVADWVVMRALFDEDGTKNCHHFPIRSAARANTRWPTKTMQRCLVI